MLEIKLDSAVFCVDHGKTIEYYNTHSLCGCSSCRNLYTQIWDTAPKLAEFLEGFGVDISKPDEAASIEMDGYIDYLFVGYTVSGTIETEEAYETELDGLTVRISSGNDSRDWFPNEQTGPCFFISVSELSLPWCLDEPFPTKKTFWDRVKRLISHNSQDSSSANH